MTLLKKNGEATESHGHQKNAACARDRNMFQSDIECWKINSEKQFKNDLDKYSDGKLSDQMNQHLYKNNHLCSWNLMLFTVVIIFLKKKLLILLLENFQKKKIKNYKC